MEAECAMATEVSDSQTESELVTAAEFRHVAGLFPTGVTVVTRRLVDAKPYGMTVSSFTSVSLDPPLVLVCIDLAAKFLKELPERAPFLINVLAEDQQHLARRFASRQEEDRFEGVDWTSEWNDVPLLSGVVASFACMLHQAIPAGDHSLLLGLVQRVKQHSGRPLIWCDRGYHWLPTPALPSD